MTILKVIDTETTGIDEESKVLELAVVTYETGYGISNYFDTVLNPGCPVDVVARAVHHISDEEIGFAPKLEEFIANNPTLLDCDYLVAHNAAFDVAVLQRSGWGLLPNVICTWRCAMHLWPNAPKHSNQVLRYWLGLTGISDHGKPPHRALSDAMVTTAILGAMLAKKTPKQLLTLTNKPALLRTVRFGKYRGMTWAEMTKADPKYVAWIATKDFGEDELYTANYWLKKNKAAAA